MIEKNEIGQEPVVNDASEDAEKKETSINEGPKPILPDEEYSSEVAKEDPEELDKARSRLMTLLRVKCKSIGGDTLALQIQPMVYSMSISDCNQMYNVLEKKGIFGLLHMVTQHNKENKKAQKKA